MNFLLLLMVAVCTPKALFACPYAQQIECATGGQCIFDNYVCDGGNDCTDASDEDPELCQTWSSEECGKGFIECATHGMTVCFNMNFFCSVTEAPCDPPADRRVCQILADRKLQPLSTISEDDISLVTYNDLFWSQVNVTLSHSDCPPLYTLVGSRCISIFNVGKVSWYDARDYCRLTGGHLLTLRTSEEVNSLVGHLLEYMVGADFWIGGSLVNDTEWTWVDDVPMDLASGFWTYRYTEECLPIDHPGVLVPADYEGNCAHYVKAPQNPPVGHCVALTHDNRFLMSDEVCSEKRSPICVHEN